MSRSLEFRRRADRPARVFFAGIVALTGAAAPAQAGEIYKSVQPDGQVIYSDHLDPSSSAATVVQENSHPLPPQLHFCWANCFTLNLVDGVYRRADGTDETWTVETFSPIAFVLHRHDAPADWNGYSRDVTYAGQVSNDRLIGITVNGKQFSGVDASWGSALNTLPGTNAERDAANGARASSAPSGTMSSVSPPPPLPGEEQPAAPEDGYIWTPGYWYWRDQAYFWIRGAWMQPPRTGVLWTPPYWALTGGLYVFHPGHWGATVGYYGGLNYGHGYFGSGYAGGHWIGDSFAYNLAVTHADPVAVHHTYSDPKQRSAARSISVRAASNGAAERTTTRVERNGEEPLQPSESGKSKTGAGLPGPNPTPRPNHPAPSRPTPAKP